MNKTVKIERSQATGGWGILCEGNLAQEHNGPHILTCSKALQEGTVYKVDGKEATVNVLALGQYEVVWKK